MSPEYPASLNRPSRSRRRRPGHRWEFERLECRTLLASSPIVASPQELAGARPIEGQDMTGFVAPGSRTFFRVDPATDQLLVATLHASGASARLILLDGDGRELTRSEGRSAADRDAQISQHLGPGTDYLEVEGLAGAGYFHLTTRRKDVTVPYQRVIEKSEFVNGVALGDFDGDGRIDLAAGIEGNGVGVLLGAGDGTFGPPATYASVTFDYIYALAVGDFDGDGVPDLVASGSNGGVEVLLGAGDGTFGPPATYATGVTAGSVAVADLNVDGRIDLVAAVNVGGVGVGVGVLLGAGDGTFGPLETYATGVDTSPVAVGDFDGDGRPDLVAAVYRGASEIGVGVLLGAGDGTFGPPATYATGVDTGPVAVGDFDGDGVPDLVTVVYGVGDGNGGVGVLLGAGDGTFGPLETYSYTSGTSSISRFTVVDLNGDGRTDLVTGGSGLGVLLGAGDGTFGPLVTYSIGGGSPDFVAVGDLNGDGRTDLVTGGSGLGVLLGAGDGTFGPAATYDEFYGSFYAHLAVGDFDGDGRPDLVENLNGVEVRLGIGDGTFGPPATYARGRDFFSVAVDDLNGDGRPDLVAAAADNRGIVVLLGVGDGTFGPPATYGGFDGSESFPSLAVGDLDGDGRPDLVELTSRGVEVLLGVGDGTFSPLATYTDLGLDAIDNSLAVGDLDGDGRPDLVVERFSRAEYSSELVVVLGVGDGTFGPPATYASDTFTYISSLVVGDLDGDGRPDLVASGDGVGVLLGVGDGTFGPLETYDVPTNRFNPLSVAVGDFDGDGVPDLATGHLGEVAVLLGAGDGTFGPGVTYSFDGVAAEAHVASLAVGDFNGDGRPDLASPATLLVNFGDGSFSDPLVFAVSIHANPLLVDANGDLAVLAQDGKILLRRSLPGAPGRYEPPTVINTASPSLYITALTNEGRDLIASAEAKDDRVSLYQQIGRDFIRVGSLPTGPLPAQVVTADLDGDGNSDLVVRNAGDGTASIFLGRSGGGFRRMPLLPIGLAASDIALADLDGSGRLSLVVTNQVSGDVRVYAGRGDGTFGPPSRYRAGAGPYAQEVGPDGTTDLTSNETTSGVAVVPFTSGGPSGLVTINPGSNTFAVLQGLGGGTLANARIIRSGEGARLAYGINSAKVVRSSDFDGDGRPDLALLGTNGVTVYLGDGRGEFRAQPAIHVGPAATGLSIADVDRDGVLDLLVGNTYGDVLILLGNDDGTFAPYRKADRSIAMVAADLTGDGQADFIYANQGLDRVTVTYGFGPRPAIVGSQAQGLLSPGAVTLADLNRDGVPDLIVANSGSNNVLVYPGLGGGRFGPAANGGHGFFTGTNPVSLDVSDLNGDGIPDLVVANQGSNDVSILYGRGRGTGWTLDPGPRLEAGSGPASTVVRDVNNDGNPDLLVSDGQSDQVRLLPGVGQGFFNDQDPTLFPVGSNPGPLFVGDFAGPAGGLDLVTVNAGSNDLTLIRDFAGGFVPQGISIASQGIAPTAALSGDFTGDGLLDILVANSGDGTLALFLGGLDDLELFGTMNSPEAPSPTSLALDALSGNVLQFYAGTAGEEAAIRLAFNLSGLGGGEGPTLPPPPSTTDVQQVARLQPLGNTTSLPLVATLLSLTVQETGFEESDVEGTVSDTSGRLPNQPVGSEDREVNTGEEDDETDEPPTPPDPSREVLSPLLRFLYGLDEAFERARRESSDTRRPAGAAERSIQALDHLLGHWSPVLTTLGGPTPALTGRLIQVAGLAARAVDHASQALPPAAESDPSIRPGTSARKMTHTPTGRLPIPQIVAAVSLGLVAAVRTSGDHPGRRSGPIRDRSPRSGPATK